MSIVFAHDADEFIDRAVAGLFRGAAGLPPPVTVVTSDGLSTGVCRGYGASVVASEAFMERVGHCRAQLEELLESADREAREGSRLAYALGAEQRAWVGGLRNSLHAREIRRARLQREAMREREEADAIEARVEKKERAQRRGGKERAARFDDARFSLLLGGKAAGLLALREALGGVEESDNAQPKAGAGAEAQEADGTVADAGALRVGSGQAEGNARARGRRRGVRGEGNSSPSPKGGKRTRRVRNGKNKTAIK